MKNSAKTKPTQGELRRILAYVRPHRTYLLLGLLLALVQISLSLYAPVLTGLGVDLMIGKGRVDFDALWPILIRLAAVILLAAGAQWLMNFCINRVAFRTIRDIRVCALEKLEVVPLSLIDSHSQGDLLSRVVTDVEQISDGLIMGFTQLFTGVVTILGTLGFMLSISPLIALIVVFVTPLSLFVARFVARRTHAMFTLQSETRGELTALVDEMVGNQKLVKAFSYEDRAAARFDDINGRLRTASIRAIFFSSLTNPSTRFVNGVVYAFVGVFGALSAIAGRISVGQLACFLTYANQYTKPFNEISGVITELQNAFACARRTFELIDAEPEVSDEGLPELTASDGSVRFDHVFFAYNPETQKLIEDLNLDVPAGAKIAIVGPTGCGKTTLINLLMRFYDVNRGDIRLSGQPITGITRASLRAQYGMVLQETWLRAGTVRENIAYGRPDATDEEIAAAARAAYADGFIRRLPQGYDTYLSEDGGSLSAGQKQLLCIARVMLRLPPVLILDEATSSIDTRTELHIQQAFDKLTAGRTSFVVAHRLSTIQGADRILVMNAGRIIEQGRHEELLAKGGFYANLYNSQFA